MWVDFAQLVRHRVPDRNGNLLPVVLPPSRPAFKILPPVGRVSSANESAVDTVAGQAVPECFSCCGFALKH